MPCMALKDLEMFCAFFMKLETMSRPKTSSLLSFLLEIIMFRSMPYTLASCMNYAYILWNQILNQSRPSGLQRFILNLVNVQESIGWAKRFSDLIIVVYYCWWFRNPAGHHFRLIVYPNIYQGYKSQEVIKTRSFLHNEGASQDDHEFLKQTSLRGQWLLFYCMDLLC